MTEISRRTVLHSMAAGAAWASLAPLASCASLTSREASASRAARSSAASALPREFRAVWVATVDNIDWPTKPGLPARTQRDEISRIVRSCARTGLNAILLQVRPTSDALYQSRLEPWSAFLTGQQGRAPTPVYDPLEVWLEEAHNAGIDVHAWVNPFRVRHPKSIGPDAPGHIANARPDLVRAHGPYLWMDPGDPAARDYALRITDDLLSRYDIQGVHMDDYFYPYPQKDKPFADSSTYAKLGRGKSLADWRRDNINTFIRDTAELVHRRAPGGLFTVSPFGIWRPENPPGIKGFDAFEGLHADSRRWLGEGWVDALMPQLYWPIESKGQPFEPLLDWWRQQNDKGRHLWPGLYLTRIKPAGDAESWEPEQIIRQIDILRRKTSRGGRDATGFALFSMIGVLEDRRGVADRLRREMAEPAFVPPSPWLNGPPPATPRVREQSGRLVLTPGRGGAPVRRWAIQYDLSNQPKIDARPASDAAVPMPVGARNITVTAVGPNGTTAPPVRVG